MRVVIYDLGNGLIVAPEVPQECFLPSVWVLQNALLRIKLPDAKGTYWDQQWEAQKKILGDMVTAYNASLSSTKNEVDHAEQKEV